MIKNIQLHSGSRGRKYNIDLLNRKACQLGFQILLQTFACALTPKSTFFHTAERRCGTGGINVVNTNNAEV